MKHLPTTDAIPELAAFWQVNDLADFEDELVEISEPVFQRAEQIRAEQMAIGLAAEDISALRKRARRQHLSEADLISRWVHERFSGKENSPKRLPNEQARGSMDVSFFIDPRTDVPRI